MLFSLQYIEMRGKKSRNMRKKSRSHSHRHRHRHRGGAMPTMVPAGVSQNPMLSPSSASLAQGKDYENIHMGQHGGAYVPMSGAPVGDTGVLDASLRATARIGPTDGAFQAIQGMSDQAGGRRRSRRSRRSKSRRSKSSRSKRSRRSMRGGFSANLRPGNASAPGTLLPPSMESRAVGGMNPEWKLAENPTSFAPPV
jgi:hypothetical protein